MGEKPIMGIDIIIVLLIIIIGLLWDSRPGGN